jgi:hypothetical protein
MIFYEFNQIKNAILSPLRLPIPPRPRARVVTSRGVRLKARFAAEMLRLWVKSNHFENGGLRTKSPPAAILSHTGMQKT